MRGPASECRQAETALSPAAVPHRRGERRQVHPPSARLRSASRVRRSRGPHRVAPVMAEESHTSSRIRSFRWPRASLSRSTSWGCSPRGRGLRCRKFRLSRGSTSWRGRS